MTTEQKAKAYDEAIKRAKAFELPEYKNIMASVFPELKESEDEKIRKELIAIYSVGAKVNAKTGDIPDRDIVAWLEKQGEQHPHVDVNKMVDKFAHTEVKGHGVPSMIEVDAYHRGIEDALKYCLTTIQIYERDKNSKTT